MNIRNQIQEGQHRANQIVKMVKGHIEELKKLHIALSTYEDQLQADIPDLFDDLKVENLTKKHKRSKK